MIAGLHWTVWLLLGLAVVPGVTLALLFKRTHRDDGGSRSGNGESR